MKYIISLLLLSSIANAGPLKIAILDSGLQSGYIKSVTLCPEGHKSFVSTPWDSDDGRGHGTNIALTIQKYIGNAPNFCILIIKVININDKEKNVLPEAIDYARQQKASIINISLSGTGIFDEEQMSIQRALNRDIVVLVAAGNDGQNLNKNCNIYPACYKFRTNQKNFGVVGNYKSPGVRHFTSNFGNSIVKIWEIGTDIKTYDITMTGTSQATAVATGKIVRRYLMKPRPRKGDYEN